MSCDDPIGPIWAAKKNEINVFNLQHLSERITNVIGVLK